MPPPLERNYYADVDYALDNSSVGNMHRSAYWAFKASLMKQGPFAANSGPVTAWTCAGSGDGSTAGMDGVDRWGTTYDVTKIVCNVAGSAHSWFVLANVTLGVWFIIDMVQNSDFCREGFWVCATAPTGGSNTARPTSTTEMSPGTAVFATMSTAGGKAHRCFDNDGYFTFLLSRNGSAIHTAVGLVKLADTRLLDTKPWAWVHDTGNGANDTSSALRGDNTTVTTNAAGWKGTTTRNKAYSPLDGTTQMALCPTFWSSTGSSGYFGGTMTGADAADKRAEDAPLHMVGVSGLVSVKGRLTDWRQTSGPPDGAAYPAAGSGMTHMAVGNCWIPWTTPINL